MENTTSQNNSTNNTNGKTKLSIIFSFIVILLAFSVVILIMRGSVNTRLSYFSGNLVAVFSLLASIITSPKIKPSISKLPFDYFTSKNYLIIVSIGLSFHVAYFISSTPLRGIFANLLGFVFSVVIFLMWH